MNKIIIGVNVVLLAAVGFLFYKVNKLSGGEVNQEEAKTKEMPTPAKAADIVIEQKGNTPTGKIAYVNIDKLNNESLEIKDLEQEAKRRKTSLEASMENLSREYQKNVEEYQTSAKAGIAPTSELETKAKYIQSIEKQAQNKQLQMDELTMDLNDKNIAFQKTIKNFLIKWNNGKYDYILSYSESLPTMLLGNTALEVTDDVISELNKEYKDTKTKKK
ncbi:MAG: OmpH family outer membrane protein [Bacteroidia bacterium]|nr:OmpH family outer membrane protein [Bacteroidia bacterium]